MIVETKLWHYLHLLDRLRPEDVVAINSFTDSGVSERWAIENHQLSVFSWSFLDDQGQPYAIWALYEVLPGVLHTWSVGTVEIARRALEWFPFLKKTFENILTYTNIHRIECYVLEGFDGAERTIRRLGFEFEGVRRAAGIHRENALMFAKVKP